MKKKITMENILYVFIVLCPILDMTSFIFRNVFHTNVSISTVIRPIIPIIAISFIFFKDKIKLKLVLGFGIYLVYGIIHLLLFQTTKTTSSYSNIIHEAQYIINYSFMILNLFIYLYIFNNKYNNKLKKSVLISVSIYISSILLAILTKTSSSTYIEGIGYKGWFESGNSISAILILSLFILLILFKEKQYKYWVIGIIIAIGIYLTTLIGTRVGLFGFILVLFIYAIAEIFTAITHKVQVDKRIIIGSISALVMVVIVVVVLGSNTIQRRKHLQSIEGNIMDETTSKQSHISGSLLEIKEKIDNNELEAGYMTKESQESILDLYKYANKYKIVNNDMRKQQLIYNMFLVKNQANPLLILFGNGYMANYRELVLEMEIPAFLFNFGVVGFLLYFVPFLLIFIWGVYYALKHIKQIDTETILLLATVFISFALAFLSGYTFFNASTTIIIIVSCTLLWNKCKN